MLLPAQVFTPSSLSKQILSFVLDHGRLRATRHPKAKPPLPELTPGDAHAVIRWLYALGKVTARDIRTALRERDSLVAEITGRLEDLGGQGGRFLQSIDSLQRAVAREGVRPGVTARERAAWRAECRLEAALRVLPRTARLRVRAVRESKGVGAAIAEAKRLGRL